jgi:hypothetical protein
MAINLTTYGSPHPKAAPHTQSPPTATAEPTLHGSGQITQVLDGALTNALALGVRQVACMPMPQASTEKNLRDCRSAAIFLRDVFDSPSP